MEYEEKIRICPECGEEFDNDSYGHDYDCIGEFGKCIDCTGKRCPYCDINITIWNQHTDDRIEIFQDCDNKLWYVMGGSGTGYSTVDLLIENEI